MVLLSKPDSRRLWIVIIAILGVSGLLVLSSLQFPWFTATFEVGSAEYRGNFDFEDATLTEFSNGDQGRTQVLVYGDGSAFGDLMDLTQGMAALGIVGMAGFGILLALYYHGQLASTAWIKGSWVAGFAGLIFAVTVFSLRAGAAGADEIVALLDAHPAVTPGSFGRPDDIFWGSQVYAQGQLHSAPGVGWLLVILAIVNLFVGTLLLYRFPEGAEDAASEDYDVESEDESAAMESVEMDSARLA